MGYTEKQKCVDKWMDIQLYLSNVVMRSSCERESNESFGVVRVLCRKDRDGDEKQRN